jgi:two-component system, OmpR family, sensor kinase
MKTNSIYFKIRVGFVISVLLMLSVFALVYFMHKHYEQMELKERLMHATRMAKHLRDEPQELNERLSTLELEVVDESIGEQISNAKERKTIAQMGPVEVFLVNVDSKKYLLVAHPKGIDVFLDKKSTSEIPLLLFFVFLAIFGVLSMFYRSTLSSIAPLSELKNRVDNFTQDGELPPKEKPFCEEIEAVSMAFDKMAKRLNDTSKARTLFLRNIAHELKTPLSKGRFLAEMVHDEKIRERFHALFTSLDILVNELLQIEKLTATGVPLVKKEYLIQDCIDEAVQSGFLDENAVDVIESDVMVCVDFRLFVLALKNLLQNGIKYSCDGKVSIQAQEKSIKISNSGLPLNQKIELLERPFVKGDESAEGLGLGLYIVKQILDAHGMKLRYEYENGKHLFCIDF